MRFRIEAAIAGHAKIVIGRGLVPTDALANSLISGRCRCLLRLGHRGTYVDPFRHLVHIYIELSILFLWTICTESRQVQILYFS